MPVTHLNAELVVEVRCDVGEGPVWDPSNSTLTFVDVSPGTVYRYEPASGNLTTFGIGQEVGAVVPAAGGGIVVAARDGIYRANADGTDLDRLVAIEADNPSNRMNDAKVDPAGRLWAGTMAFDFAPGAAALYRVTDAEATKVIEGLTISNGLGWSPDGQLMYFIDSAAYSVDVFDFDIETGQPSARRVLAALPEGDGMPDGLTVDAEGNVWVAYFGASVVRSFTPSGKLRVVVDLPVSQPTSVTFGGESLDVLYITTAAYELDADALAREPLAGSVFQCRPGVVGLPPHPFGAPA